MTIETEALGSGQIVWLGINIKKGAFSSRREEVMIDEYGILGDMYNSEWRPLGGHDGDYIQADGLEAGNLVRNMRQLTIVDELEIMAVVRQANAKIQPGMLREGMIVRFKPSPRRYMTFSQLPVLSRMVIQGAGGLKKILHLTEQNQPCSTITNPIARFHGEGKEFSEKLKKALRDKRGQMAAVHSFDPVRVSVGDKFIINPPM